jgi:hypothetical protein
VYAKLAATTSGGYSIFLFFFYFYFLFSSIEYPPDVFFANLATVQLRGEPILKMKHLCTPILTQYDQ